MPPGGLAKFASRLTNVGFLAAQGRCMGGLWPRHLSIWLPCHKQHFRPSTGLLLKLYRDKYAGKVRRLLRGCSREATASFCRFSDETARVTLSGKPASTSSIACQPFRQGVATKKPLRRCRTLQRRIGLVCQTSYQLPDAITINDMAMTRSYSRQYSSVQNIMKRRLGSDELGLQSSSWSETMDGKCSQMNARESRMVAEIRQSQRDDAQLCGAIHAETRQEGLKKLSEREEQDAKHRPGRIGQVRKRVEAIKGVPFAAKDPKGREFWDQFIPSLSKSKAGALHKQWKEKHGGTDWPSWARHVMRQLENKAITVEAGAND